jgi:thymidylate kinase
MCQRIEFMGLPGAGKTTCAGVLLGALNANGQKAIESASVIRECIRNRDDGVIRNIAKKLPACVWEPLSGLRNAMAELHRFSYKHSELLAHVFAFMSNVTVSETFRECITHDFFKVAAGHQLICEQLRSRNVVVFEEGFCQVGCLLLGYLPSGEISASAITQYIDALPPLHAVVWVDTSPEVCLARLEQREKMTIGLVGESRERQMQVLRQSRLGFQCIATELSNRGVSLHRLQNDNMSEKDLLVSLSKIADSLTEKTPTENVL